MTHGLNHPGAVADTRGSGATFRVGRGRGRGRGRGSRGAHTKARPQVRPRVIKCDKCGYEFPAEVNERILVEHITKYHMRAQQQQQQQQQPQQQWQHERLKPATAASPQKYSFPQQVPVTIIDENRVADLDPHSFSLLDPDPHSFSLLDPEFQICIKKI